MDKADSEETYNPDLETSERLKRHRRRRRIHSTSDDNKTLSSPSTSRQTPHTPVIAQVAERPDPSIIRLHHDPYEAGDRARDVANLTPVVLKSKHTKDDQQYNQYSSRSNPVLFFDNSNLPDRAATATHTYASSKRVAKTRLETDREAMMRYNDSRAERQNHKDDPNYIDKITKDHEEHRVQPYVGWFESEIDNQPLRRHNYQDEYTMAKRSVFNTKNLISSIQRELGHMPYSSSDDYHA